MDFGALQGGLLALLVLTHVVAALQLQFLVAAKARPGWLAVHVATLILFIGGARELYTIVPALWWSSMTEHVLPRAIDLGFATMLMVLGWAGDSVTRLRQR